MTVVLDASAVLAVMFGETGAEQVRSRLSGALISSVNLSESFAKMLDRGFDASDARRTLLGLGVTVEPFGDEVLWSAGALRGRTRSLGVSFADRACLALALHYGLPALTADRRWAELDLGVPVELIR